MFALHAHNFCFVFLFWVGNSVWMLNGETKEKDESIKWMSLNGI